MGPSIAIVLTCESKDNPELLDKASLNCNSYRGPTYNVPRGPCQIYPAITDKIGTCLRTDYVLCRRCHVLHFPVKSLYQELCSIVHYISKCSAPSPSPKTCDPQISISDDCKKTVRSSQPSITQAKERKKVSLT